MLAQFMKTTVSHQKSIDLAIKNLEVYMSQLAKQMAERPTRWVQGEASSWQHRIQKCGVEEFGSVLGGVIE